MAFNNDRVNNNIEIIHPINEVDAITGSDLREHISHLSDEIIGVVINFSKVNYLNSSGLRELIQSLKLLKDKGKTLALCGLSDNILKIFTNTNLHKLFEIRQSEDDAIKFIQETHTV